MLTMGQVTDIYNLYNGKSIYMVLFFCALIFLCLTEENHGKKTILVYSSLFMLFYFFCPITAYVMLKYDQEIFYRTLWFLPVSVGIAYAVIRLIGREERVIRKLVIGFLACLFIICGGDYSYDNPTFVEAENLYHIPNYVKDVADAISPHDSAKWVDAVVPQEMISYIRQYDSTIHLPYGREVLIERWNLWHPMFQTMEAETVYAKTLAEQAREENCQYIILHVDKVFDEDIQQYDFKLVDTIDDYCIYLDIDNPNGVVYDKGTRFQ